MVGAWKLTFHGNLDGEWQTDTRMSAHAEEHVALEIAHVLCMDIVGYSKLPSKEQRAAIDALNDVVRGSNQFQKGDAADRLIKIPTGDGMILVFQGSPEAPATCAVEV